MITALEALVHTNREYSTKQFVKRVHALADEVDCGLAEGDLEDAYDLRSKLVHGGFQDLDPARQKLYMSIEEVLRRTIRKGIEDHVFAKRFEDDSAIRRWVPVP